MSAAIATQPFYCGPAPVPGDILSAWNADPFALALCCGLAFVYLRAGHRAHDGLFASSLALIALLFVSPLCALTVALFSARVAHHVLLIAVAAPLLAIALSHALAGLPRFSLTLLVGIHALVIWVWHIPGVYEVAVADALPYWAMQASLLATGVLLWRAVIDRRTGAGEASLALLATVIQMGMLGALLTFAGDALYEPHRTTTLAFGLTPLADQQLGGLIMWVPAALPYVAAALWKLSGLFEPKVAADRR